MCVGEQMRYFTFMYFEGSAAKSVVCNYIPDESNLYLPFTFGSWTPRLFAAVNFGERTESSLVIWCGRRRAHVKVTDPILFLILVAIFTLTRHK